jgi:hypothetical protein
MNIQTVATNLRNTIAGKEQMLVEHQCALAASYLGPTPLAGTEMAFVAIIQFLKINIDELKRVLQDVEQCEPSLPGEGNNYEKWDGDE